MAFNVGDIFLNLKLNKAGFQKDVSGVKNLALKAGAIIAGAFAVHGMVNFSKKAIQLGSDLAEVQNVVDVAFPKMSKQVEEFSQNAIKNFGLSEIASKKYMGTFGAMSKAFGFTEKEAYNMSSTLTGLAGDVASFYNIDQDAAYTKLKSVFTGETESLKDLGVVMTQSALDSYAMANGFGKVTSQMSESEKVALRFAFVTDQLSLASGDFIRTSGGWANQVRVMRLQLESFMATVGQGLINIFTPVLKMINMLLSKLMTVANAFKAFTELISGNKATEGAGIGESAAEVGELAEGLEGASAGAEDLGDATGGIGDAAKKAAKEMKALMGFDKINKLSDNSDASGSGSGGSGGGASGAGAGIKGAKVDMGKVADNGDALSGYGKGLQKIISYLKELGELVAQGFDIGLNGNSLQKTQENIQGIEQSIIDIFSSPQLLAAGDNFLKTFSFNLGRIAGSTVSVGISIAENLTGGLAKYLDDNKGFIVTALSGMLDGFSKQIDALGMASETIGVIAEALKSDGAVRITEAVIEIFGNGFLGAYSIFESIGGDILQMITKPFYDNQEAIKGVFEDLFAGVAPIVEAVADSVTGFFATAWNEYETKVAPLFESLTEGLSSIVGKITEVWNTYIAPIVEKVGKRISEAWTNHISPFLQNFAKLFGDIAAIIKPFWESILQPLLEWLVGVLGPVVAALIDTFGWIVSDVFASVGDILNGFVEILRGITEFLTSVFTGDWQGAFDAIGLIVDGFVNIVSGIFSGLWAAIETIFAPVIVFFESIFIGAKDAVVGAFQSIGKWFGDRWEDIKGVFSGAIEFFSNIFGTIYETITGLFGGIAEWFGGIFSDAWEAVKNVFSAGGEIFFGIQEGILSTLKEVINALIEGINTIIQIPFDGINAALDGIRGVNIMGFEPFSWLPSIWTPQIPYLAQGGFVKANTPQLAMIGDNKYYGEIVAPENKLHEMAKEAAELSKRGAGSAEIIALLKQLLSAILSLNLTIDGKKITAEIVETINSITAATGENPIVL